MPDEDSKTPTLGLMSSCEVCGGNNALTGIKRPGPPDGGLGPDPPVQYTELQIRCGSCGRQIWFATGDPWGSGEGDSEQ